MINRPLPQGIFGAALVLGIGSPSPALAGPVNVLTPVTPWNVDYAPKTCVLRRGYGDAAKPDLLMMERFGPSDTFQVLLISNELRSYQQGAPLYLRYGDGERVEIKGAMPGETEDGRAILSIPTSAVVPKHSDDDIGQPPVTPAQEAAATSINLDFRGRTVTFKTGPLDKAFVALRKCTDQLVESWGFDPVQQRNLWTGPKPLSKPASWLTSNSYPSGMLMQGKQGLVNFRLTVDEKGMPTACEVQRSYSHEAFDKVTCQLLMQRARFSPAIDGTGKPIASFYINRVRFTMGG